MDPSTTTRGGWTLEDSFQVTVSRGPTTFIISAQFADIETKPWGKAYLHRIGRGTPDASPSDDGSGDPSDLILGLCLPVILKLAPGPSIQGLLVDVLAHAPIYHLEIVGEANSEDVVIKGSDHVSYGPSFDMEPVSTATIPESCVDVTRVPAYTLTLASAEGEADPRAVENVQGRVRTADGKTMYFKPRFGGREQQFHRELAILGSIAELSHHRNLSHRFSCLEGIVTCGEDGSLMMGILLHHISTSAQTGNFFTPAVQARTGLHARWKAQVTGMVKELNGHGIVWGDVNAGNVVVDDANDAWIIDFGGMTNPEFVDDELTETEKGDLQGIGRLFGEWLTRRSAMSIV